MVFMFLVTLSYVCVHLVDDLVVSLIKKKCHRIIFVVQYESLLLIIDKVSVFILMVSIHVFFFLY